jgi:selenocysteine-specific elongation factor
MRGVLEIHGPIIHLKDYVPELPAAWETPAAEIEAVFIAAGYQPPHPNAFVYPRQIPIGAILMYLVDQERLITLGDDIYIAKATYDSAVAAIKGLANHPDGITVGNVRDATGSSRKVILPLLERLDGLGMTRRYGDFREWVGQRG